jgi:hypothetical protein
MSARKEHLGKRVLFQASSREAGEAILQSRQMKFGRCGLFGPGIYFASTGKSAQYKSRYGGADNPSST